MRADVRGSTLMHAVRRKQPRSRFQHVAAAKLSVSSADCKEDRLLTRSSPGPDARTFRLRMTLTGRIVSLIHCLRSDSTNEDDAVRTC